MLSKLFKDKLKSSKNETYFSHLWEEIKSLQAPEHEMLNDVQWVQSEIQGIELHLKKCIELRDWNNLSEYLEKLNVLKFRLKMLKNEF